MTKRRTEGERVDWDTIILNGPNIEVKLRDGSYTTFGRYIPQRLERVPERGRVRQAWFVLRHGLP